MKASTSPEERGTILHIKKKKQIDIKANCTSNGYDVSEKGLIHIRMLRIVQNRF